MPESQNIVLIVDDREQNRYSLARYLKLHKFEVWEAGTGQEALQLAQQKPSVITLDVQLPDYSGFEVCKRLKADPVTSSIPVIMTSAAFVRGEDRIQGLEGGADGYLVSPIEPEEWVATIRALIRMRRAEIEAQAARAEVEKYARILEERVAERTSELEETVKSLEGFCYTLAHDLRAPLRAIRSFAEILYEEHVQAMPPEARDYTNRIRKASDKMDALINDLLRYGRLNNSEIPSDVCNLDLHVEEAMDEFREEILARKAVVEVKAPLHSVVANSTVLMQVITNLIGNALKFVEASRAPVVRIESEKRGGMIRLWVRDNGIGIAAAHHQRIFSAFERIHQDIPGTGIGLAIVRKGVERMGGSAGVEAAVGAGSAFWVELPAAPAT